MLTAAKDEKVKRFIYAASSSTYGDYPGLPKVEDKIGNPLSPYAVSKYVNELYASVFSRNYDFHTIGLRYFNVFGPKQNPNGAYAAVIPLFVKAALNHQSPVINGDGKTSRDFTFVENAVQANIKALFAPDILKHDVINIAYGEQTSLNELWAHICNIAAISIPPVYAKERKGDVKHSMANIKKAEAIIGYRPCFSPIKGLEITVAWYMLNNTK